MKRQLLVLLLFTLAVSSLNAQKYALLDKKMKLPIIFTDSVTVEQIRKGWFPVENKNVDTLIANLHYLKNMLDVRQRAKMKSFELHAADTKIKTLRIPYAYGDRYNSLASTRCGEVTANLTLINSDLSNKKNADNLDKLLSYLKSNKEFFKEPNEVQPKLYEVIVITE